MFYHENEKEKVEAFRGSHGGGAEEQPHGEEESNARCHALSYNRRKTVGEIVEDKGNGGSFYSPNVGIKI